MSTPAASAFRTFTAAALALAVSQPASAAIIELLKDGNINRWEYQTFDPEKVPNETEYKAVNTDEGRVLEARSEKGASLLYRRIRVDLRNTPFVHFDWRTFSGGLDVPENTKQGDDFAMRLYFVEKSITGATRTLVLVRSNNLPAGSVWESPYSNFYNKIMMYALAGPGIPLGQWRNVSVNLRNLWEQAYGDRPFYIDGVGLMTDTDDTGSKARTQYGNISITDFS